MDDKRFDKEITQSLIKNTDHIAKLKEETFKNIITEINNLEERELKMKRKKFIRKVASIALLSTITVSALLAQTETGQAAIDKIKEFFAPEKQIVQELEGQKEDVNLELEEKVDYVIYVDKEIYKMETVDGIDRIVPKQVFIDGLPEISMTIEQIQDENPNIIADELMKSLEGKFPLLERIEVNEPYDGILIYGHGGSDRTSAVQKYYIFDNTKGGSFVITQNYFLEAAEGHGVRFDNMLKEFRIIPAEISK